MKLTSEQHQLVASTLRCLCADMIDQAKSGHPGAPLGMADLATVLWFRHLNVDPLDPKWALRDRLVFSGGHASSLVYALFHLSGMAGLKLDELKAFRQWGCRCAGHPERGLLPGVEVTTGPLGQGIAMGVGLALAAKKAGTANRTWVFCGDGDLEEGISHEAASFAGAMKLDSLVVIYDSNRITIEGDTALAMNDDTVKRFESYGWKVFRTDGHDPEAIDRALKRAEKVAGAPVLVVADTHIGFGAPTKQDSAASHGARLGAEETAGLKRALKFDPAQSFVVPDEVAKLFAEQTAFLHRQARRWTRQRPLAEAKMAEYLKLMEALPKYAPGEKQVATRTACGQVLTALAPLVPGLVGGSADLGPSNKTIMAGQGDVGPGSFEGRNVHYGVRELAMAAIANGLTAFGGFRGYGSTFFVFADYCKPAIRLAALMHLPTLFIFSHDSFYVGEDGPTHEPVEQLAMLRATPGLVTYRPADANEAAYCLAEMLLDDRRPSCLVTSRQDLEVLDGVRHEGVARGGYVIYEGGAQDSSAVLFLATGSEVALAIAAAKRLVADGRSARVVSLPSVELFLAQPCDYRGQVVPEMMTKRVIVEAGTRFGWDRFRLDHRVTRFVTLDHFGASAPCGTLAEKFGFTAEHVYDVARQLF